MNIEALQRTGTAPGGSLYVFYMFIFSDIRDKQGAGKANVKNFT